ncbi:hypothetical protein GGTG_13633, partial [Gaeumannomyces tritici R3-111a-1]
MAGPGWWKCGPGCVLVACRLAGFAGGLPSTVKCEYPARLCGSCWGRLAARGVQKSWRGDTGPRVAVTTWQLGRAAGRIPVLQATTEWSGGSGL